MSIVEIDVLGDAFKTIIIETSSTVGFLNSGSPVNLLFKETEVSIAKSLSGLISLQNKFNCVVVGVKKGRLLSSISLDYKGLAISSVITSAAADQLDLREGDKVTALIKTNEIILAPI